MTDRIEWQEWAVIAAIGIAGMVLAIRAAADFVAWVAS